MEKNRKLGRPTLDGKLKLAELMDRHLPDEELISNLADLVRNNNMKAYQLWFNYKFGAPKQTIDQESTHTFKNFSLKDLIKFDEQDNNTK
jgi:hypothetical protein